MSKKPLTLSIIVPVFNEENYLGACLGSIAAQTQAPDEVIVVDNNSTDKTVDIAKKYSFTKIIAEKRQHQVFAQAAGFNSSKSDILGRIDGDSILPPDWVQKVKAAFEDEAIMGVTGGGRPYDGPLGWIATAIFNWYVFMVRLIVGHRILWGANCAIRRSGWQKIKSKVLLRPDIWEDYNMSFCLARHGKIKYLHFTQIGFSLRSMHANFIWYVRYQFRSVRTFYLSANPLQLVAFSLLWTTTFLAYPLAVVDYWLSYLTR